MNTHRAHAYVETLITIVIWGIASVVIKATLGGVDPVLFLTYRFFLSSLVALLFLKQIKHLLQKHNQRLLLVLLYAFLSAPLSLLLLFAGMVNTSVVNLSLMQATVPVLLAFLGAMLFHDHMTRRSKIGAAIAITGAFITLIEPLFAEFDGSLTGNLLIAAYLASDVASILLLKKLLKKGVSPTTLTHFSFLFGFILTLPLLLITMPMSAVIEQLRVLPVQYHLGIFYMAIFSGTIAFVLRGRAQKFLTITEASLFGYLAPVISTVLALLFLNEHITPLYLIGALTIGVGVFLAEFKRQHKHKATARSH